MMSCATLTQECSHAEESSTRKQACKHRRTHIHTVERRIGVEWIREPPSTARFRSRRKADKVAFMVFLKMDWSDPSRFVSVWIWFSNVDNTGFFVPLDHFVINSGTLLSPVVSYLCLIQATMSESKCSTIFALRP